MFFKNGDHLNLSINIGYKLLTPRFAKVIISCTDHVQLIYLICPLQINQTLLRQYRTKTTCLMGIELFSIFMRCCLNVQIESRGNTVMRSGSLTDQQFLHQTEIEYIKLVIFTKISCFPVFKMGIRNSDQPFLKYDSI